MRTIVRDGAFEESCERLFGTLREADDRLQAVEWALIREKAFPQSLYPVVGRWPDGSMIRALKTNATKIQSSLVVVFSIRGNGDGTHAILHDLIVSSEVSGAFPLLTVDPQDSDGDDE